MNPPVSPDTNTATLLRGLDHCETRTKPFSHWIVDDIFDDDVVDGLLALPFEAPRVDYGDGRRAANNDTRSYFDPGRRDEFEVCQTVAQSFQAPEVVDRLQTLCGTDFSGGYLRLEYAQDREGFWLHPHKDISVKMMSLLVYLSDSPTGEEWGTDIYSGPTEDEFYAATPHQRNRALIFIPGQDTWHGYRKGKKITGVRQTLIVNYVTDAWINRHELAFPDTPI